MKKIKSGSKKIKKFSTGSIDPMSIASGLQKQLEESMSGLRDTAIDAVTPDEIDFRNNPTSALRTADNAEMGKNIKPGLGLPLSIAQNLLSLKKRKKSREDATTDWGNKWNSTYQAGTIASGFKEGGEKTDPEDLKKMVGYNWSQPYIDKYKRAVHNTDSLKTNYLIPALLTKAKQTDINKVGTDVNLTKEEEAASIPTEAGRKMYTDDSRFLSDENQAYLNNSSSKTAGKNESPELNIADQLFGRRVALQQWANPGLPIKIDGKEVGKRFVYEKEDKIPLSIRKEINMNQDQARETTKLSTGRPMQSKAKGGEVTGAGGPKSDSIVKKVEDGSFIVPAENADIALDYGRSYLGWKDNEMASRSYPGSKVKLSDGEVLFTPKETSILKYHGVDLDALAPAATESVEGGGQYKDGTIDRKASDDYDKFSLDMRMKNPDVTDADITAAYDKKNPQETDDSSMAGESLLDKIGKYAPEALGALQIGMAVNANRKAGAMPDINVNAELKSLAIQARKDAEYGLEPGAKSAMLNAAETTRRDMTNAAVGRGGSSQEVMANLQGILSTTIGEKYKTELADVGEKARKQGRVDNLTTAIAGQDMDIQKESLRSWREIQEVNAGLLSSGISNIVGSRKLKAEMEMMDSIKKSGKLKFNIGGKDVSID